MSCGTSLFEIICHAVCCGHGLTKEVSQVCQSVFFETHGCIVHTESTSSGSLQTCRVLLAQMLMAHARSQMTGTVPGITCQRTTPEDYAKTQRCVDGRWCTEPPQQDQNAIESLHCHISASNDRVQQSNHFPYSMRHVISVVPYRALVNHI